MKYLLDTSICIYLIKKKPASVLERFTTQIVGDIGLSSISVAELEYGVQNSQLQEKNQQALFQFLAPLAIANFDAVAATVYGQIRAALEIRGMSIGSLDTLIAAHAISLGATLVTNNEREFSRVPGLGLENWASG